MFSISKKIISPLILITSFYVWAASNKPYRTQTDPYFSIFDGNRIHVQLANNGTLASSNQSGPAMYWPSFESEQYICYYSGVWVAGKVNGEYRTACTKDMSEWRPGTILADGTADNPYDYRYRIYKIEKSNSMSPDWIDWPIDHGAPWIDNDNDGIYNPYSGDTPALYGSQMLWYVANDLSTETHDQVYLTDPLGIECQVWLWGSNRQDFLGDVLFSRIKFIHKGEARIDSCFIGVWANIEIGKQFDDLVGTDTTLSMMYAYNDGTDDILGRNSPVLGVQLLQGAHVPSLGDTVYSLDSAYPGNSDVRLHAAQRLDFGGFFGPPKNAAGCFNLLSGRTASGQVVVNPITGGSSLPVRYATGDPEQRTGWIDAIDALSFDRRILISTGPFTFSPQDTQDVIVAFHVAQAESPLASVPLLKEQAKKIQILYEKGLKLSEPPATPQAEVRAMDRRVLITWSGDAESYVSQDYLNLDEYGHPSAYRFQGYNVYQLETDDGSGAVQKIATFDVVDGVTKIKDTVYESTLGEIVEHTIQDGSDSGIQRYLFVDQDKLNDMALINHRPYHFAVTAYGYNPEGVPKVLESAIDDILTILPTEPQGMEYKTSIYDSLTVDHSGPGQGSVSVYVMDPGAVTGHDYEIQFEMDSDSISYVWTLIDVTSNGVILNKQQNQSGDNAYSIVDGLLIKVAGHPPGINWDIIGVNPAPLTPEIQAYYHGWGELGRNRWIDGYDLSSQIEHTGMKGGLFTASDYFGYSADRYVSIRLDVTLDPGPDSSQWSKAYVLREDLNFAFKGIGWFPGKLWDLSGKDPKQLNIAFLENNTLTPSNYTWDMGFDRGLKTYANGGEAGNHEVIFLMDSEYDAGQNAELVDQDWSPGHDTGIMYAIWPIPSSSVDPYAGDFTILIYAAKPNTSHDVFSFSTHGLKPAQTEDLAKEAVQKINVFPNPYLGGQVEERHALEQFVRFTHLPQHATIRIYSLLGDLVRKLEHDGSEPYEEWDLRNYSNIQVGSGVYLVHVDCGSLGEKVLKLAVVLPEEQL